jgi:hypothetical protein
VRISGSPRSGNAVTSSEPARFPSPKAATSDAPAPARGLRLAPNTTAMTERPPKLTAVSIVATLTRRSGPWPAISASAARTVGTSSRLAARRPSGGSDSVATAATTAAPARASIATAGVAVAASAATSAGPAVPPMP